MENKPSTEKYININVGFIGLVLSRRAIWKSSAALKLITSNKQQQTKQQQTKLKWLPHNFVSVFPRIGYKVKDNI